MIDENFLSAALILAKEELDVGDFVDLTGGAVRCRYRNANEKVQPAMFRVPYAFFWNRMTDVLSFEACSMS